MKILIAADMEGISGVVDWDQVTSDHPEYGRFRRLMTGDVNAAVRGALEAGADQVIVTDGHSNNRNILIEELNPRARLNTGGPSPFAMVQGVDSGVDGAMFIGYHARVGAQNAILDHTWSSKRVMNLWLNGRLVGETGLNAAVCGHFDVPVLMVSGNQTVCAEATELLGPIETAVVKWATGRMAAECLSPEVAQQLIYEAAVRAIDRLREGQPPKPLRLSSPITLAVELATSKMADQAAILPGARRVEGRRIEFSADDMPTAYRALRTIVAMT
jgi:D-amino peptidase